MVSAFDHVTNSFDLDWAGCAGLWAGGLTPLNVPTFAMYKEKQ
jgi:hypothetical protein